MSRITMQICGALLSCALIPTAFADDTKAGHGDESLRDLTYASLGVSREDIGLDNVGSLVNLNFSSGIRLPTFNWISAELAGSATVIPGKVSQVQPGTPGSPTGCGPLGLQPCPGGNATNSTGDASTLDIGVYAAFRSPGRIYATGRIGWRYFQTTADTSDGQLYDERTGVAFGGGLGWRWGQTLSGVELTYTRVSSDVNLLGLGIVYGFGGHY